MKKKLFIICLFVSICFLLCGCGDYELKPPKLVNEYEIVAEYNEENKTLSCNQKVVYVNKTDTTLKEICFYLHANAFREGVKHKPVSFLNEEKAYPNGKSYGGIDILSVQSKNNTVDYEITGEDNNILKILLDFEFFPDEKYELQI
ncbi:MAG: hypothetical protein IKA31_01825, partial [Clostridia bacterium]|nr:hypothetical protein [Clostridia bacterium]